MIYFCGLFTIYFVTFSMFQEYFPIIPREYVIYYITLSNKKAILFLLNLITFLIIFCYISFKIIYLRFFVTSQPLIYKFRSFLPSMFFFSKKISTFPLSTHFVLIFKQFFYLIRQFFQIFQRIINDFIC